ncbi:unnamed protein product, partial [Musa banksii]
MEHRVIEAYQWQIGHFRTYQFIANGAQRNWSISEAKETYQAYQWHIKCSEAYQRHMEHFET